MTSAPKSLLMSVSLACSSTLRIPPSPPPPTPSLIDEEDHALSSSDRDVEPGHPPGPPVTLHGARSVLIEGLPIGSRSKKHPSTPVPSATQSRANLLRNGNSQGQQPTWLLRRFQPSLVLENTGSVARDHLASERTFLAYVRTSLAIASAGVALNQLFSLSGSNAHVYIARPLGAVTVGFAIWVLCVGLGRFFTIQSGLTRGVFPVGRWTVASIAIALGALVVAVFALSLETRKGLHV